MARKRRKNKKKFQKHKHKLSQRRKIVHQNKDVIGQGYVQPGGCQTRTVVNPKDDEWETDLEVVTECGKFDKGENGKVVVWVEPLAKVKIDALMEEYKTKEWLGYLLGDKEELTVKDIFIPEQKATSARVDDIECEEFNDLPIIGVIHSHHNMGTNFSHTDHTYINQNHDISLLVAHSGIGGQIRKKVPCGAFMVSEVKVRVALTVDWDKDEWMKDAKEKIKTPVYNYNQSHPFNPSYQQPGRNVQQGKPQFDGTGYWFNGQWHPSYPKESMTGTWLCTDCNTKNYNQDALTCAHCHGNRFASKAEENQFKIEKEWQNWEQEEKKKEEKKKKKDNEWSSGISKKSLGTYICGRCNRNWENVNLKVFNSCPECDGKKVASIKGERHQCPKCKTVWIYDKGEEIYCEKCDPKKGMIAACSTKYRCDTCNVKWLIKKDEMIGCPQCDNEEAPLTTESYKCKGCNVIWEIPAGERMECPKCDADVDDLVEELKKDLENVSTTAEYYCAACEQPHWTIEEARDCCNVEEDDHWTHPDFKCKVCGKATQFENTVHRKCMGQELV
jgi:hypothetical protein